MCVGYVQILCQFTEGTGASSNFGYLWWASATNAPKIPRDCSSDSICSLDDLKVRTEMSPVSWVTGSRGSWVGIHAVQTLMLQLKGWRLVFFPLSLSQSKLATWSEVMQYFINIKLNCNLLIVGFIDLSVDTWSISR